MENAKPEINDDVYCDVLQEFPLNKCVPSKNTHVSRNKYQKYPSGVLECKYGDMYTDSDGKKWFKVPWYLNLFHNPAMNIKLLYFDDHHTVNGVGSSEVIVPRRLIQKRLYDGTYKINAGDITRGSYNYRDIYLTNHWKHFWADIFPNLAYCKCV